MIHPSIERAFQEIDAGCFSSDQFDQEEGLGRLEFFLERWTAFAKGARERVKGEDPG